MRRRDCPKCKGTGNAGYLSSWRCDACNARGWFDIADLMEYSAYRKACEALGIPVETTGPDSTPRPGDDLEGDWPDDFDDA